jgi:hypothetical protein
MKAILSFLLIGILFSSYKEYTIRQEVRNCVDNSHFQIDTYIERRSDGYIREIIYSSSTWMHDKYTCLVIDSVFPRKEREYKLAESFLIKYKKTIKPVQ